MTYQNIGISSVFDYKTLYMCGFTYEMPFLLKQGNMCYRDQGK